MASNKKYWQSVEELNENSPIVETLRNNEFAEEIPVDEFLGDKEALSNSSTSRRDFLKFVGFSTAAASLAACQGPVIKSIPYVVQPEEIIPGVWDYYATTMADGFDFANILVKTREGRPIKVEANKLAGAKFSANGRVHASVLSLYDSLRLKQPLVDSKPATWTTVDAKVAKGLAEAAAGGGQVVVLTGTVASPSTEKLIAEFGAKYGANFKHVVYDAVSSSEALDAYQQVYGERALADYDFGKADVILAVGADFLGDWQGGGFDGGYAQNRIPKKTATKTYMSKHIQIESNMTLSGANADKRIPLTVTEQKYAVVKIFNIVTGSSVPVPAVNKAYEQEVIKAAEQLSKAGTRGVFVTGLDDVNAQLLAFAINQKLASEAFNPGAPRYVRKGDAKAVKQLVADMKAGAVHTLILNNVNPVYTLPNGAEFAEVLKKVKLSVSFTLRNDETAKHTTVAAAAPHYLESWGDVSVAKGYYAVTQPTIRPLFDTKQFQDALLSWSGNTTPYYDYLKAVAATAVAGKTWNQLVHDGVAVSEVAPTTATGAADFSGAAATLASAKAVNGTLELVLYTKTGLGDGQQANNPWLQEFPDPITRTSWDNYITVSKADAEALGLENWNVANGGLNGSVVTVTVNGVELKDVPVIIQPGQAKGTAGLALGYGRAEGMKAEMVVGVNAYTLYNNFNSFQNVKLTKQAGEHEFACVQLQKTLMGRGDIVKETTLADFGAKSPAEWNEMPQVSYDHQEVPAASIDLWESFDRSTGHHFNLSIDLNACTGCGACVIACHAENNVPVVGKSEIRRSRDMHWLRIDRYYSSEETFKGDVEKKDAAHGLMNSIDTFTSMEDPSENPQVVFQPVMCQHCNHAPCETVCPVAATSHGRQGQNHMAYNRCVGTRYCANNCPYKVRRFNWFLYNNNKDFDFNMNDDLGRMVLNPDVVVRSRGVMEKCSFCIQATQAVILQAKRDGRVVGKDEFNDACACSAACSSGAMVFGDVNNAEDPITRLKEDDRAYHLLDHIGTKPNVFYHVKVRNT
ncbi:quinol:cytochrome C oxidoreductase [Flavobacterium akiainvivens]|uniref:Quinol:cytochrome C oxidoreductase n=1 Tax=Flavobacterium akiainvivens TaxID=1202724 RepID=A0A0M9VJE6_9FLAO|nr:TAT-variant-translocated molybdopterin oxidoreductase [Flavobacterium akiainvivens]KOS07660.1 quinol:cytochrome C oxidoreductase [Flavobacterium akiainvivens]SFQ23713.1 quinol:cytochrome c oxidoreductase iron-sulfur protein precursor [Flavobacterium akiainvivens]